MPSKICLRIFNILSDCVLLWFPKNLNFDFLEYINIKKNKIEKVNEIIVIFGYKINKKIEKEIIVIV